MSMEALNYRVAVIVTQVKNELDTLNLSWQTVENEEENLGRFIWLEMRNWFARCKLFAINVCDISEASFKDYSVHRLCPSLIAFSLQLRPYCAQHVRAAADLFGH